MKTLFYVTFVALLVAGFGCAITNYPIIVDDRGDYSGIIRTAHKAYIVPSGQVATIYADGSDELFSLVYQNQYGDQSIQTHNNFDPTGAVSFLDQTYCDWKFEDCELARAWNPIQNDDDFDYEFFEDCSGARSLSLLLSQGTRFGECGDNLFADKQGMYEVFSNLETTTWRGESAYVVPIDASTTTVTLTGLNGAQNLPIFGSFTGILNDKFQFAVPMTPNARHQINYIRGWVAENGSVATVDLTYQGVSSQIELAFRGDGLGHNAGRF